MKQLRSKIHNHLQIQRWKNGVRLVDANHQEDICHGNRLTVHDIMQIQNNFYFLDPESNVLKMNETAAKTCGYISANDAVGRSIRHVAKPDTAQKIIANDKLVVAMQSLIFNVETFTRLDERHLSAISFKFPCYQDEKIIGLFGCSLLTAQHEIDAPTQQVLQSIFIGTEPVHHEMNSFTQRLSMPCQMDGKSLNDREISVIDGLYRGYTAKGIAKRLGLSHRTIEHRIEALKIKFAVKNKSELIEKIVNAIST